MGEFDYSFTKNLNDCEIVIQIHISVPISELATPGGPPTRSRPSSKMTKYVECWGADKPFANITDSKMAKNIGLAVSRVHVPAYH